MLEHPVQEYPCPHCGEASVKPFTTCPLCGKHSLKFWHYIGVIIILVIFYGLVYLIGNAENPNLQR